MQHELIGILASVFVLASFVVNNIRTVRFINIIGASLFVVYGILIGAFSTWLLNGILIFVHIYYLNKQK